MQIIILICLLVHLYFSMAFLDVNVGILTIILHKKPLTNGILHGYENEVIFVK